MERRTVDMIALCSADGQVRPLRFQIKDADGEQIRVDVDEVISQKLTPYVGVEAYTYVCRATVHKRHFLVELKYYIRSHTWYVLGQYSMLQNECGNLVHYPL